MEIARYYERTGNQALAEQAYLKAIELDNRFNAARMNLANAFLLARETINEMYANVWWISRFFQRQTEALAALRDRPTHVERDDPNRPGETRMVTATQALLEDERRMIALHSEMEVINAQYGAPCPGIQ